MIVNASFGQAVAAIAVADAVPISALAFLFTERSAALEYAGQAKDDDDLAYADAAICHARFPFLIVNDVSAIAPLIFSRCGLF